MSTEDFVEVMVTNALSPMRVVEALESLVTPEDAYLDRFGQPVPW